MRSYSRKSPSKEQKKRLLIYCCAQTEQIYFNYLKEKYRLKNVSVYADIKVHKHPEALQTVNGAIAEKDKNRDKYDQIWCVFDYDKKPDFDEAIKVAEKNDIKCAFSNMAIEFWFLLHKLDTDSPMDNDKLKNRIKKEFDLLDYKKGEKEVKDFCKKLDKCRIEIAEERADRIYQQHKKDPSKKCSAWQSSTSIFRLTRELRGWKEAK